jgi:hypothetical protein
VGLAVLPIALTIVSFYGPVLSGSASLTSGGGDLTFYEYQLKRSSEVGGRWWKVADDARLGGHYQSEVAKHAGIFEGVDLMLLCAWPGRTLDASHLYHLAVVLIFASNGWAAAWMVYRLTRSYAWASMSVILLTTTIPTMMRALNGGHLHLAKHGFVILAAWAFARYLARPTRWIGVWLGLATAGVLQGSFYRGYHLGLVMATWWLGALIAGKVSRRHAWPTLISGLTFGLAAALLTFPVWTVARSTLLTDSYFERKWSHTWLYGSELWQYFLPVYDPLGDRFIQEVGVKSLGFYGEGMNFPGLTVLASVAMFIVMRLRGWRGEETSEKTLNVLMGLAGLAVILSLAGGPGFFLFWVFPSFRCYGRSGHIALALGCAAAPLIVRNLLLNVRSQWARGAILAATLALITTDAIRPRSYMTPEFYAKKAARTEPSPEWVAWLAGQPAAVHLAAFGPVGPNTFYSWGIVGLKDRMIHDHTTLNGGDFRLIEGDLALLGATYERMNRRALEFLASLGYETLAFHDRYLDNNPWLKTLDTLEPVTTLGPWRIVRVGSGMPRLPRRTIRHILATQPNDPITRMVPAGAWITGQFAIDQDVVVAGRSQTWFVWTDESGRRLGPVLPALFQHVFGPGIPAYTVQTPKKPGRYHLTFLDESRRRLASRAYTVSDQIPTLDATTPDTPVEKVATSERDGEIRLIVENPSGYFVQAHNNRETVEPSVRAHPGILDESSRARGIQFREIGETVSRDSTLLLPSDLPPGGRIEIVLDRTLRVDTRNGLEVRLIPPLRAELQVATAPSKTSRRQ